jgi:hypothetical protein
MRERRVCFVQRIRRIVLGERQLLRRDLLGGDVRLLARERRLHG